jgi:hypothetical protein
MQPCSFISAELEQELLFMTSVGEMPNEPRKVMPFGPRHFRMFPSQHTDVWLRGNYHWLFLSPHFEASK